MEAFLQTLREPMPRWLSAIDPSKQFPVKAFFNSRIAFYPGSGFDGHLVKVFGSTHVVHCFVYADYGVSDTALKRELDDPQRGFRGYHSLARIDLEEKDLLPSGWVPHVTQDEARYRRSDVSTYHRFGFVEILERNEDLDDEHGAKRLAIMFLGADGVAAYDALFCQKPGSAPFVLMLQDHGFSGNYTRFGRGGLLGKIVVQANSFPEFILCADNTEIWPDYRLIPEAYSSMGGARQVRRIYVRELNEIDRISE